MADRPPFENASSVLHAIVVILSNRSAYREGLARSFPEVSQSYRPLLEAWLAVVRENGDSREALLARAMNETRPLIETLVQQGEQGAQDWLDLYYYRPIFWLRESILSRRVGQPPPAVKNAVSFQELQNLSNTQYVLAKLGVGIGNLATSLNRIYTPITEDLGLRARILVRYGTELRDALQEIGAGSPAGRFDTSTLPRLYDAENFGAPTSSPGTPARPGALTLPAALIQLQGVINGINGAISLLSAETRARILANLQGRPDPARMDLAHHGGATAHERLSYVSAGISDILKIVFQFISAGTALSSSVAYGIAVATRNTGLAARLVGRNIPVMQNMSLILNVIGVVHGASILLNPKERAETKIDAAYELSFSALGIVGPLAKISWVSRIRGIGPLLQAARGVAGPASLQLAAGYAFYKGYLALLEAGGAAHVNLIEQGFEGCLRSMESTASEVHTLSLRLASALQLAHEGTAPEQRAGLARIVENERAQLADLLRNYLGRVTLRSGADDKDPAAWGPPVTRPFAPLLGRDLSTAEKAGQTAVEFVEIVTGCLTRRKEIFLSVLQWRIDHGDAGQLRDEKTASARRDR
jgi:hypothetical protein